MAALDELEYTLRQLKLYIGTPLTPGESIAASQLYDKALQKILQARIQERDRLLARFDQLERKIDMIADLEWAKLKEIQERERQTI